jgi:rRNA maturation endonuclease Nob1
MESFLIFLILILVLLIIIFMIYVVYNNIPTRCHHCGKIMSKTSTTLICKECGHVTTKSD